jgi:hypothetical protein
MQQPTKVSRIVGIYLEEAEPRAKIIGEVAVASFPPSDFGQKKEYCEIRRVFRRPPIVDCTQQPTKLTRK